MDSSEEDEDGATESPQHKKKCLSNSDEDNNSHGSNDDDDNDFSGSESDDNNDPDTDEEKLRKTYCKINKLLEKLAHKNELSLRF